MRGRLIVDHRLDFFFLEELLEVVSLVAMNDVQVTVVSSVDPGRREMFHPRESLAIMDRNLPAFIVDPNQAVESHVKKCSLKFIKTGVTTVEQILPVNKSVVASQLDSAHDRFVIRQNHPAIPQRPEILCRVKAEGNGFGSRPDLVILAAGSCGLSSIF